MMPLFEDLGVSLIILARFVLLDHLLFLNMEESITCLEFFLILIEIFGQVFRTRCIAHCMIAEASAFLCLKFFLLLLLDLFLDMIDDFELGVLANYEGFRG
jgi:hypothetical protein